eukprot:2329920-Amphidinium_carterae.1
MERNDMQESVFGFATNPPLFEELKLCRLRSDGFHILMGDHLEHVSENALYTLQQKGGTCKRGLQIF